MMRIVGGFVLAQAIGIPLGLLLGASKTAHSLIYPVFEIMRPVPPLAWVPVAVIFWPTPEMSMVFVTFLGAFFIVVINIVDGVRSIDARYLRAARSLRFLAFRHVLAHPASRQPSEHRRRHDRRHGVTWPSWSPPK